MPNVTLETGREGMQSPRATPQFRAPDIGRCRMPAQARTLTFIYDRMRTAPSWPDHGDTCAKIDLIT